MWYGSTVRKYFVRNLAVRTVRVRTVLTSCSRFFLHLQPYYYRYLVPYVGTHYRTYC